MGPLYSAILIRIQEAKLEVAPDSGGGMAGEVLLESVAEHPGQVRLVRGAFYHVRGIQLRGRDGSLVLVAWSGEGTCLLRTDASGDLTLTMQLQSRFAPNDAPASGIETSIQSGTLKASLVPSGPGTWNLQDGTLLFAPIGPSTLPNLNFTAADVTAVTGPPTTRGFTSEKDGHGACPGGGAPAMRITVTLQPVGFKDSPGDTDPTGGTFASQLNDATAIWRKACIAFSANDPVYVEVGNTKYDDSLDTIIKTIPPGGNRVPGALYVFFVKSSLGSKGGGDTDTLSDSIVMPELAQKPKLLAHEIGHYLGGLHPAEGGFGWQGSPGSVMDPTGVDIKKGFSSSLTTNDCISANRHVPQPSSVGSVLDCCTTPDQVSVFSKLALHARGLARLLDRVVFGRSLNR